MTHETKHTWGGFWDWYRILRQYHHWGIMEALKWALWLSR